MVYEIKAKHPFIMHNGLRITTAQGDFDNWIIHLIIALTKAC